MPPRSLAMKGVPLLPLPKAKVHRIVGPFFATLQRRKFCALWKHERYSVRYEVAGPDKGITYVLVNGLTQYAELWAIYARLLSHRGIRVVTFDLLGQGSSDKPALFINQADLVAMTDTIINETARGDVFLAGISFGGLVALRYAIEHTDRLTGLVAMSTFAELSPQLQLIGNALRNALVLG